MITRRRFVRDGSAGLAGCGWAPVLGRSATARGLSATLAADLDVIEQDSGGRLGVAVFDALTGTERGHRADERFPICSTFKLLAVGAILARVDAGQDSLDRRVVYQASDVVPNSALIHDPVDGEMSLEKICEAAMVVSDNTAGNLLLAMLGRTAGLTAFARTLGDPVTRLDRVEPELNEAVPGDPRDTTSPAAMLSNVRMLALGDVLSERSKDQLVRWLVANKTGDARLRAGLPSGWRVGDKTGTGERGTANDIGIMWPPGRPPIIVSAYLTGTGKSGPQRNATLAAVGRAVARALDG